MVCRGSFAHKLRLPIKITFLWTSLFCEAWSGGCQVSGGLDGCVEEERRYDSRCLRAKENVLKRLFVIDSKKQKLDINLTRSHSLTCCPTLRSVGGMPWFWTCCCVTGWASGSVGAHFSHCFSLYGNHSQNHFTIFMYEVS